MLALLLAATIDSAQVCAKYKNYTLPPAAVNAVKECEGWCDVELAQQFANGEGVNRDYDVAEYFLCAAEERIAPAEFEGMFEHVQQMRDGVTDANLHFCDHVTSGYGASYCANLRYEELMPELDAKLDAARKRVAPKSQFDALKKAADAYVDAETERIGEQSRGGTGYAAFTLEAEMNAKNTFVEAVEQWTSKRAPIASTADAKRADDALNANYRSAQDDIEAMGEEFVSWKTYLRDAQRAWIAYRDAFATFYVAQWRGQAADDVLRREIVAQLTRERAAELKDE
ncbi:MAG TPA: lysozyme inhibitor LprI family protein [Thermoanaerobaculia bacterium]